MSKRILLLFFGVLFVLVFNTVTVSGFAYDGKCNFASIKDPIAGAICVGNAIKDNKALVQYKDSVTSKFIDKLVEKGIAAFKNNPGVGVVIVLLNVIKTVANSYSLAVVSKSELMSVQFEWSELEMVVKTEIIPILRITDEILNKGATGRGMVNFCERRGLFFQQLEKKIYTMQAKRKEVEQNLIEKSKNKGFIVSILRRLFGDGSRSQVIQSLQHIHSNAMHAEASLRMARSEIENACTLFLMNREPTMVEWLKHGAAHLHGSLTTYLAKLGNKSTSKELMIKDEL